MKINNFLKIIIILFIILNFTFPTMIVKAVEPEPLYQLADESNFEIGRFETSLGVPTEITDFTDSALGTAISIARIVGIAIAIVILMVIGCKYMISSPGDRADIKKHAIPFVIGAVVLFGASGILGIVADVATGIQ